MKKINLKSGSSRNYYYKEFSNGEKKQITKKEFEGGINIEERLVTSGIVPKDLKNKKEVIQNIIQKYNANKLVEFLNEYDKLQNEVILSTVPNFSEIKEKIDKDLQNINKSKLTNQTRGEKTEEIIKKYTKEYKNKNKAKKQLLRQTVMTDKRNDLEGEIFDYVYNELSKPN